MGKGGADADDAGRCVEEVGIFGAGETSIAVLKEEDDDDDDVGAGAIAGRPTLPPCPCLATYQGGTAANDASDCCCCCCCCMKEAPCALCCCGSG